MQARLSMVRASICSAQTCTLTGQVSINAASTESSSYAPLSYHHNLPNVQGGAEAEGLLSCTQPCHRMLPDCDHLCQSACHKGACPGPCLQPVTVRCDCRRLKSKMPCQEVRQKLAASGQLSRLEPSAAVKLLLCNAECIKAKVCRLQVVVSVMSQ